MMQNASPGIYNPIMGALNDPSTKSPRVIQGLPIQVAKPPPTFDINNPPAYKPTSQTAILGSPGKRNQTSG